MNDDPELERRLRGFRPSDPSAALRERVLSTTVARRAWPWAAAAAALLVSALTLRLAMQQEVGRIDLGPDRTAAMVDNLTEALGGDQTARNLAESIVIDAQLRADATSPSIEGEQP